MKLTPSAEKLLDLMRAAGGSYCPGADAETIPEVHRIIRGLVRNGLLKVEETDDGYRYTVQEDAE